MHNLPQCTDFCHDLLIVIQRDMLVIHSEERKSCEEIWVELNKMYQQCRIDKDYAARGNPWNIRRESFSRPVALPFKEETTPTSPDAASPKFAFPGPPPPLRQRRGTISVLNPAERMRLLPRPFPEGQG